MDTGNTTPDGRRLPFSPLLTLAGGAVMGVLSTAQYHLHHLVFGRPVPLSESILQKLYPYLAIGALAMPIVPLAARFPLRGGGRAVARSLLVHLAAASAYVIGIHMAIVAIGTAFGPDRWTWRNVFWGVLGYAAIELFIYFSVVLAVHAVSFFQESRRRAVEQARLEASLTEARLLALRTQLNPHFLFNTLNAISALALRGEREAVAQVLARLSEILRASLDERRGPLVPLEEELAVLDGYLDIQQVRFGDRLRVTKEIAPETLRAHVPILVTQPVVENAVAHGVSHRRGAGSIQITAVRDGADVILTVSDDGPGFRSDAPEGIGLGNTRARLAQLFGGASSLTCGAAPGGGARVTIRLPFRDASA